MTNPSVYLIFAPMQGIKHIIFDLGAVILNIDYHLTQKAFEDLGISDFGMRYSKLQQSDLFDQLETGKIGEAEFIKAIQDISDIPLSDLSILAAWNAMLLDFPLRRLQILQQLQLHYNTYLLSNTNEIHERAFNQKLQSTCGYPTLAVFFDKIYLSHRIGLRKPDPAVFQLILDNHGLAANETLFIDDSQQHIESAAKLGIQTIHMTGDMTIEKDIFLPK
ncbi:MAG: HAD family phosphatase [Chitinophagaceae bacterium]|nr:HAD family phosphatase [Chitinophagaceae bacterium]